MNDFEKAAAAVEPEDFDYSTDVGEFAIEWLRGQKVATVTFPVSSKYGRKVLKLAESHPDDVEIVTTNNGRVVLAHIPVKYISIRPPRVRAMTDSERDELKLRLQRMREKRAAGRILSDAEIQEEELLEEEIGEE